jgi:hypothetical protein
MTKISICNVSHRTRGASRDLMNLERNRLWHISTGVYLIFATFTQKNGTLPLFLGIDRRAAVACCQYFENQDKDEKFAITVFQPS